MPPIDFDKLLKIIGDPSSVKNLVTVDGSGRRARAPRLTSRDLENTRYSCQASLRLSEAPNKVSTLKGDGDTFR
jgi:hypothetical protein